jgi:hypothetical protein
LLDAGVRFANIVLAVLVRIKVDLAGSSEADGDSGDEEGIAELHGEEYFGTCLWLFFVLLLLDAGC